MTLPTPAHPAIADGVITVAALVVLDGQGRMLTVRKAGTSRFMLPGGKLEPGELPVQAAVREAREEVGRVVAPGQVELLGELTADAANEPGHVVVSTVYVDPRPYADDQPLAPGAEIAELRWLDLDAPLPADLAPLLRDRVVPALRERRAR